ncbi:hypothetical protein P6709_10565 [Jeotgalibacillus sp. ET6]|uniref:hypothetical protein n=1 Tax=Jeotgalibacillus sp. ET6 TaxID=3037260 RepID=UPI00241844AB|nr:hypothetical protein [Jeotgalibacillus sp. ET6]MDG5472195.1 hypothetical protein [Jeotgalibacillus sp. ET6]
MESPKNDLFQEGYKKGFSFDRAFQEEFTRQFIPLTQETEPGFYPLRSAAGSYEMIIPEETIIDSMSYTLAPSKDFESYLCYINRGDTGTVHLRIAFFAANDPRFVPDYLAITQSHAGEKLAFDKVALETKDVYMARGADQRSGDLVRTGYIGYVQHTAGRGGMQFYYDFFSSPLTETLHEELKTREKATCQHIMHSVVFHSQGGAANGS